VGLFCLTRHSLARPSFFSCTSLPGLPGRCRIDVHLTRWYVHRLALVRAVTVTLLLNSFNVRMPLGRTVKTSSSILVDWVYISATGLEIWSRVTASTLILAAIRSITVFGRQSPQLERIPKVTLFLGSHREAAAKDSMVHPQDHNWQSIPHRHARVRLRPVRLPLAQEPLVPRFRVNALARARKTRGGHSGTLGGNLLEHNSGVST
jgi:hypothetical protein